MTRALHNLDAIPRPTNSRGGSDAPAPTSKHGQRGNSSGGQGATVSGSANCEQPQYECKWCHEHPFDVCPTCARLGRRGLRLMDADGLTAQQAASKLSLELPRMQRLIEEERQRHDLVQYKRDRIPLEAIQAAFAKRQKEDPSLSQTRAAELAKYKSRVHFLRTMGFVRAESFVHNGKRYPAKFRTEISVEAAGRIVRAIGCQPREFPDL